MVHCLDLEAGSSSLLCDDLHFLVETLDSLRCIVLLVVDDLAHEKNSVRTFAQDRIQKRLEALWSLLVRILRGKPAEKPSQIIGARMQENEVRMLIEDSVFKNLRLNLFDVEAAVPFVLTIGVVFAIAERANKVDCIAGL